jgi:hypothetical protein
VTQRLRSKLRPRAPGLPMGGALDQSLSRRPVTPSFVAQCTQQKMVPSCLTPCPMMRQPQCEQVGARLGLRREHTGTSIAKTEMQRPDRRQVRNLRDAKPLTGIVAELPFGGQHPRRPLLSKTISPHLVLLNPGARTYF